MNVPRYARWACAAAVAALLVAGAVPAQAQETGRVQGQVLDATTQQPLDGAQVFVPGTGVGTLTNSDGRYMLLNVPAGEVTVRVQVIGYGTQDETVQVASGDLARLNFEMSQSAIALDEVVVTGAGVATEKRKLGNTIGTVDVGELENAPVANVSELLQGREPGVVGMPSGGLTGEGAQIRIRGSASLTQSNEPIVYIDGVRVDNAGGFAPGVYAGGGGTPSRLDDINPESIERVEILKGAAAATLYGTEASNGVIQIFTKDGYSGDARWSFQFEQGALRYPGERYKANAGFARNAAQAERMSTFSGQNVQPFEVVEAPFVTDIFETGQASTFSGSVTGGNSTITYFLSGRYQNEDGPLGAENLGPASDRVKRKQGTLTVNIFPTENLRLRATSLYSETNQAVPNNNNNIFGTLSLAMFGKPEHAFCSDPTHMTEGWRCENSANEIQSGVPTGQVAFMSLRESFQTEIEDETQHYNGSVNLNYTPMEGLTLDATFGADVVSQRSFEFTPYGHAVDGISSWYYPNGFRDLGVRNHREVSFDGKAAWTTDFSRSISSSLVIGSQVFHSQTKSAGGFVYNFPGPGLEVASAAAEKEAVYESFLSVVNAGVFAQEQIGYEDFAFLTLGARYDANSAFGENFQGVLYPKASLSVTPSTRAGWTDPFGISTVRLRGAIGQSGQQPGAFDKFTTFAPLATSAGAGLQPRNLGNQDLKPEISTEWEVGTEIAFLDDRLALDLTYWDRTVTDALVDRQFPVTGGFMSQQLDNIGEIKAEGLEVGVNGMAYNSDDVSVDLFASAAYLRQKVTDMGAAPDLKVGGSYPRYRNFIRGPEDTDGDGEPDRFYTPGALFGAKLVEVGAGRVPYDTNGDGQPDTEEEFRAFFASAGETDPGALAKEYMMLADEDGDGNVLDHYLGKPVPDWSGSLGGTVRWGRFELSNLFEFKAGNFTVTNLTDAFRKSNPVIGRNTPEAAKTEATLLNPESSPEQRVEAAKRWANEFQALAPFSGLNTMEDGDFLRWREASLTYNAPAGMAQRVGASSLAVTLSGRNLMLWTGYSGIDPELNVYSRGASGGIHQNFGQAIDAFGVPLPRRVSFRVRVGF